MGLRRAQKSPNFTLMPPLPLRKNRERKIFHSKPNSKVIPQCNGGILAILPNIGLDNEKVAFKT